MGGRIGPFVEQGPKILPLFSTHVVEENGNIHFFKLDK